MFKIQDKHNFMISTKNQSKVTNPSLENGKHLLKCHNEYLYKEGDRIDQIFYLIEGKVLLFKSDEFNTLHKLSQANPGTFLGLSTLFDSSAIGHSATVTSNSLLMVIPVFQFKDLIDRWPELKHQIIGQLIHQLDSLETKISKLAFFS